MVDNERIDGSAILVVEDEMLIRTMVVDHLRDSGYAVIEAANADEAIAMLRGADAKIDLVFSDVNMPGAVDGFGLARWVRQNKPHTHVLLTSGGDPAAHHATDLRDHEVVPKPFGGRLLLARIRDALARH